MWEGGNGVGEWFKEKEEGGRSLLGGWWNKEVRGSKTYKRFKRVKEGIEEGKEGRDAHWKREGG